MSKTANCNLYRIYLDRGGYELGNGTYWGHGQPLYRYSIDDGKECETCTLRASSREAAKATVLKWFPQAKFYR